MIGWALWFMRGIRSATHPLEEPYLYPAYTPEGKIERILKDVDQNIYDRFRVKWSYHLSLESQGGVITECDTQVRFYPEHERMTNMRANTDPDRARELYLASEVIRIVEREILTRPHFRVYIHREVNGDTTIYTEL